MLSDRQTLHLFPTRVTTGRLIDAPDAAVAALVLARSRTTPSVARGERSGWQSGNDFLSWSADTARLGRLIADAVMAAHDEAAVAEISLFGWANLFTRGVHFSPHLHADAAWSGAYYLDAGDSSAERSARRGRHGGERQQPLRQRLRLRDRAPHRHAGGLPGVAHALGDAVRQRSPAHQRELQRALVSAR
jgi:hypothetical protein